MDILNQELDAKQIVIQLAIDLGSRVSPNIRRNLGLADRATIKRLQKVADRVVPKEVCAACRGNKGNGTNNMDIKCLHYMRT